MSSQPTSVNVELPHWINSYISSYSPLTTTENKMHFVIEASKRNVTEKTGGPFAAAIFDSDSHELISLGTNIVTNQQLSILHAEIVAITVAQKKLQSYDLGSTGKKLLLVSSSEPCAMCYGAIPWSGISALACGATDKDVRDIGFDEGPKLQNWADELIKRKINVITEVQREKASQVLTFYQETNGCIYNPTQ